MSFAHMTLFMVSVCAGIEAGVPFKVGAGVEAESGKVGGAHFMMIDTNLMTMEMM